MRYCYLLRLQLSILLILLASCNASPSESVRKSSLAGIWYPAESNQLASEVDRLLSGADTSPSFPDPVIFILPHAGYAYSGSIASRGYRMMRGMDPDLIVILGPSHRIYFRGCGVAAEDFFETPLGRIRIAREEAVILLTQRLFVKDPSAGLGEHSVEIHLPFIQRAFPGEAAGRIKILPLVIGEITLPEAGEIAKAIAAAVSRARKPLFIVSSDFTHYGKNFGYTPFPLTERISFEANLRKLDQGAIDFILKKDAAGFTRYMDRTGITVCGKNPIAVALSLPLSGFHSRLIAYQTSGEITGDFSHCVSYAAVALGGKWAAPKIDSSFLNGEDKKFLLKLARENIRSFLYEGKGAQLDAKKIPTGCLIKRGLFVTLKVNGNLRGCVGTLLQQKTLPEAVLESSSAAAFRDSRFEPLKKSELDKISIEISVLTEPVLAASQEEILVGRDGLIVEKDGARGLLLPQVPEEWGWTREEFLKHTCLKAGLPEDSWKRPGIKIYRFQALVFKEE